MKKLSLIIPCYNESKNLPSLITRCVKLAEDPNHEIIFVNNGSTDNTNNVLKNLLHSQANMRSISLDINRGYGFGIIAGLNAATGDILAWTHADMQTDPLDCLTGLELFKLHGANIFIKGKRRGRNLFDQCFTIAMSVFETLLFRKYFWDINAQPTMFSREFYLTWKNPPHDFSLDLYAYYLALKSKFKICRFPVNFASRLYGKSHWNVNWVAKKRFIMRTINFSLQLKRELY